jgi:uncharacterized phage protein (TIGR01671 family)
MLVWFGNNNCFISHVLHLKQGKGGFMREIKFRAWDKYDNRMILEPTVFGEYYDYGEGESGGEEMEINKMFTADDHLIFMQFTGLHDKNSKEIYEGDILKLNTSKGILPDKFYEVYWHKTGSWYQRWIVEDSAFKELPTMLEGLYYAEVIGNIYSNPELMEL